MIFATLLFLTLQAQANNMENFLADLDSFQANSVSLQDLPAKLDALSTESLAKSLFWSPDLILGATKERSSTNKVIANSDSWYLSSNWNLFHGGGDFHSWRAASARSEAGVVSAELQKLELQTKSADLIFQSLQLRDFLSAQKDLLQLKQSSLEVLRGRYGQGKVSFQEVRKAEVDYSQQENLLREQTLEVYANSSAIRALFVQNLETKDWPFTEEKTVHIGSNNLQLTKVGLQKNAAESLWKSIRAIHLPSLDLNLLYSESPLKNRDTEFWKGTLTLSIPLWNRMDTSAKANSAYADFRAADSTLAIETRADEENRRLLDLKLDTYRKNLQDSRRNLEKAEQLYKEISRGFALGRISTNELFEEQTRLIQSKKLLTSSKKNFHSTLLEICALRGLRARECLVD